MPHEAEAAQAVPAPRGQPDSNPAMGQLMVLASRGDHEAFTRVHQEYSELTLRRCRRVIWNTARAEDANQEIWTRIWKFRGHFKPQAASVRSWVLSVAQNYLVDELRKQSRNREVQVEDLIPLSQVAVARTASPHVRILLREVLAMIRSYLSEEDYEIFLWSLHGETYESMSSHFYLPEGTVKSRLFRIRKEIELLLANHTAATRQRADPNALVAEELLDPVSGVLLPSITRKELLAAVEAADSEEEEYDYA